MAYAIKKDTHKKERGGEGMREEVVIKIRLINFYRSSFIVVSLPANKLFGSAMVLLSSVLLSSAEVPLIVSILELASNSR